MDESAFSQNRKSRRANLLMAATIEVSGRAIPVRLRNLSRDGALIEGDRLPIEGSELLFRKGQLAVAGRIAWVIENRAGVAFTAALDPETVLRNVPAPKPHVAPVHRRPGLASQPLTESERQAGDWLWSGQKRD